jgi:FixJ family two-component response regulator
LANTPVVSIVDDDRAVCTATQAFVRSLGMSAFAFTSAEEFLRSAAIGVTDCLIADIQMPGMNGVELQRALAALGRDLPIIFITAFPDDRVREQVLAGGAIGMLPKPYDGNRLITCINSALARRGPA